LLEVLAAVGRGSGASDPTKVIEMMGRIAVVLILIVSGVQKLMEIAGTADQVRSKVVIPAQVSDLASRRRSEFRSARFWPSSRRSSNCWAAF
jgi:hypothetical protein